MKIFIWTKATYKDEDWWYDGTCIAVADSIEDAYMMVSTAAEAGEEWELKPEDAQIYNLEGEYPLRATLIRAIE